MSDVKSESSAPIKTVNTAAGECHPAEMATSDTVQRPAARQPIGNEGQPDKYHKPNPAVLDLPTDNATHTLMCEWCSRPIVAKRSWKRFCNANCRQRAFQARKEAGQ